MLRDCCKSYAFLLGARGGSDHHDGRKQCQHGPAVLRPHRRASLYGYCINEHYPTPVASPSYPIVGAPRALAHGPGFVEANGAVWDADSRCGVGCVLSVVENQHLPPLRDQHKQGPTTPRPLLLSRRPPKNMSSCASMVIAPLCRDAFAGRRLGKRPMQHDNQDRRNRNYHQGDSDRRYCWSHRL